MCSHDKDDSVETVFAFSDLLAQVRSIVVVFQSRLHKFIRVVYV